MIMKRDLSVQNLGIWIDWDSSSLNFLYLVGLWGVAFYAVSVGSSGGRCATPSQRTHCCRKADG